MTKGTKVRVVMGGLLPGWMGIILRIERQWNMSYAMVDFKGVDYPVRLSINRLQAISNHQG